MLFSRFFLINTEMELIVLDMVWIFVFVSKVLLIVRPSSDTVCLLIGRILMHQMIIRLIYIISNQEHVGNPNIKILKRRRCQNIVQEGSWVRILSEYLWENSKKKTEVCDLSCFRTQNCFCKELVLTFPGVAGVSELTLDHSLQLAIVIWLDASMENHDLPLYSSDSS